MQNLQTYIDESLLQLVKAPKNKPIKSKFLIFNLISEFLLAYILILTFIGNNFYAFIKRIEKEEK